jgi:hypothetical protein
MTFFLQDVSNGQAPSTANTLAIASAHVQAPASGGSSTIFTAATNPILVQPNASARTALLVWNAPANVTQTEIHLSTPDGPLFAEGGGSGSAATGDWVTNNMVFVLEDVSNGKPSSTSNEIGQIQMSVEPATPSVAVRQQLCLQLRPAQSRRHPCTTVSLWVF